MDRLIRGANRALRRDQSAPGADETTDRTDLQVYTERQPEAFDALAAEIAAAISQLGSADVAA